MERIQMEDIAEIRNCINLFNDFGKYVKNIMKQIDRCEKCGYITNENKDFKKHMKIVHRK